MARPPKPDQLKILQGTARPDRMNHDQPKFDLELDATPPTHLSALQIKIWEEIVPRLQEQKLYTTIDLPMISVLCVHLAKYWEIESVIGGKMYTVNSQSGKITCNNEAYKLYMIQSMAWNNANKIMTKYGMSPVDRQKMKIEKPEGKKYDDILPPKPPIEEPLILNE